MSREFDARETRFGRYLEDFEVGDVYKHWPGKTITEADDHLFCMITMNHHPLHIDEHYAQTETQFGTNVVVGNLVYSLVLGMSVPDVSGKAIANLEIESLKHAEADVPRRHDLRPDHGARQGRVAVEARSRHRVGADHRHQPARRGGVRVPAQGARAQAAAVGTMASAISVTGLTKRYGDYTAVDGVSFGIAVGETFGILGPNGAGKTTTLEMIEGLRKPDAGQVFVLGEPVWPDPRSIQSRIGVQLQSTNLFEALNGRELLSSSPTSTSAPTPGAGQNALQRVGLESKAATRWTRSPAARSSGSRSPWRWCTSPRWYSSTSPPPASTPRRGTTCGT